ncbi:TPA: nucleotidyltransferase domain-containing protein [Candidatus Bathyarchaeota archaeon]|nr:nucleotidyltransferase domain-containing protein [Candidatus Bathyarchaeota archaeon]
MLKKYISGLLNLYGDRPRSVCLFGSLARGEAGPESDVDVLVVDGLPKDAGSRYEETSGLRMGIRQTEAYNKFKRM